MRIKKLHLALALGIAFSVPLSTVHAQLTESVYSIFGLGELGANNIGMNRSLGGTGIAFQSNRSINYLNPASYLGVTPNAFVMEVGVYGVYNNAEKGRNAQTHKDIDFSYGSFGLHLTDWWSLSLGVLPFSQVGYTITSTVAVDGELSSYEKTVKGSGSIKRAYLGNSFLIMEGLAAGLNVSYIGGSITESETGSGNNTLAQYQLENKRTFGTAYLDYGVQYSLRHRDWDYTLGLVYGASTTLDASDDLTVTSNGTTTSLAASDRPVMKIPQKIGLGFAAKAPQFKAGFDYEWQNWSTVRFSNSRARTRNSSRYSLGVEYMPGQHDAQSGALAYRCGVNYRSSYIEVGTTAITSYGLTVGMGIPSKGLNLNVSVEYGEEGTLDKGLIRNRYWMLYASVSVFELWHSLSMDD